MSPTTVGCKGPRALEKVKAPSGPCQLTASLVSQVSILPDGLRGNCFKRSTFEVQRPRAKPPNMETPPPRKPRAPIANNCSMEISSQVFWIKRQSKRRSALRLPFCGAFEGNPRVNRHFAGVEQTDLDIWHTPKYEPLATMRVLECNIARNRLVQIQII